MAGVEQVARAGWEQARYQRQEIIGGDEDFRAGNWVGNLIDGEPMERKCMDSSESWKERYRGVIHINWNG